MRPARVDMLACLICLAGGGLLLAQATTRPASQPAVEDGARGPAQAPAASSASPGKAPNPHWREDGCSACHAMAGTLPQPIEPGKINPLCMECHDGRRAHREVHPVGRRFAGDQVVLPKGWPAPDNLLTCATCHEFGKGHAEGGRPQRNAFMLRDYKGGSFTGWCAKCHISSPAHKPFNPHDMVSEAGEVKLRNCLVCHTETSDILRRKTRMHSPDLQLEEVSLCVRCHMRHLDWFEPGHIGHAVTPEIKQYMLQREAQAGIPATARAEGSPFSDVQPNRLPLSGGRRIVCSTCHNPHGQGVFPPGSVLGMGAMKTRKDHEPLRYRGLGEELCRGCHNK